MAGQNDDLWNVEEQYWYRQRVVDKLHNLYTDGNLKSLSLPEVIEGNGLALVKSAIILFGSWEHAISEAGVKPENANLSNVLGSDYWTPERILEQIKILFHFKFDLSAHFIKSVYPELYYLAKNKEYFGGWSKALDDAEIDFKSLRRPAFRFWTLARIFRTLHDYEHTYGNIQSNFIRILNPSLYSASHRYFRTWAETIASSGLKVDRNMMKVLLEPFREFILMECVKKIYETLEIEHKIQNTPSPDQQTGSLNVLMIEDLPNYRIETSDVDGNAYIMAKYRSWDLGLVPEICEVIDTNTNVIIYHSIGEPRQWLDDKVQFINIKTFYPELMARGRDDLIAELALLARGGIPKKHEAQFNIIMKSIKKMLKKKGTSGKDLHIF